jgi:hypothetical protein
MCVNQTTLQKFFKKYFCKKLHHTHTYIISHLKNNCNTFLQKSVDNFFIFKKYFLKKKIKK